MSLQESRGSYEYRAICDVCRDKLWASDLKQRWDMLWTCKQCWEARHPSDFYRNRSDVHKLPFTRPDTEAERTFPAQSSTCVDTPGYKEGHSYQVGTYSINALTSLTKFTQVIVAFIDSTVTNVVISALPKGTTRGNSGTFLLPTTATGVGTYILTSSYGKLITSGVIAAGGNSVTPALLWPNTPGHLIFSGSYIT